ncbi:MAG: hypothetical protein ACKVZ0_25260 [Gemmatimonadales bacterium]
MRAATTGLFLLALMASCAGPSGVQAPLDPVVPPPAPPPPPPPPPPAPPPTYDVDLLGVPKLASRDYLDLGLIEAISRFRSSVGHDYHDAFETCRNMKHYFRPRAGTDWAAVSIYAPAAGTIVRLRAETTFGSQVVIRSAAQPAFQFILFHVTPEVGVDSGVAVLAGQRLGHHVGSQTMSDIAVGVDTPAGYRLLSWFEVIADSVFSGYATRGVASRAAMVISRAERDGDPLSCVGEAFIGAGSLGNWVALP